MEEETCVGGWLGHLDRWTLSVRWFPVGVRPGLQVTQDMVRFCVYKGLCLGQEQKCANWYNSGVYSAVPSHDPLQWEVESGSDFSPCSEWLHGKVNP